jgi:hypothetical protein
MSDTRIVYAALLRRIFDAEISIRTEAPAFLREAKYLRRGFNDKQNCPVIQWPRVVGGKWLDKTSDGDRIVEFINGASNLEDEVPIMAHEYGHHFSTYKDYETVRSMFDKDPKTIALKDRRALFKEEVFAWSMGRNVLLDLGYQNWKQFEILKKKSLEGYRSGYAIG